MAQPGGSRMLSKRVVVVLFCLFTLLWIGSPVAFGQSSSTGTVTGTVTDSSAAAVPGATVYLTDTASGGVRPATTNDKGFYAFPYVAPGTYSVKVSKQGFKTTAVSDQVVQVGVQLTVNAVLEVGSVSQTVEVTYSAGAELQTMSATVGATLSGATLNNLPNTSRDASTLAVLQPGQNINGNVGGAASDQNSFLVDGGFATDDMSGDNNTYIAGFGGETAGGTGAMQDRKSTRLNSSHSSRSYAVICLKKKTAGRQPASPPAPRHGPRWSPSGPRRL